MAAEMQRSTTQPESLVSTEWVSEHLADANVRLVESNEDPILYRSGHITGAVEVDWTRDLNDPLQRDYLNGDAFSALMSRIGVSPDTTVVFYGDKNNWWATYAFWVFSLFGHKKLRIMDGGRMKWEKEGREVTRGATSVSPTTYPVVQRNDSEIRAFRDEVLVHSRNRGALIDVRSPEEYSGERLHMEAYPNEGALRGGHIPSAKSVPWARAVNPEDGTFRPLRELQDLYLSGASIDPSKPVIAYCRIGERSSHTWFVLKHLLGIPNVKNYDGSWTEWGNSVGLPIEKP